MHDWDLEKHEKTFTSAAPDYSNSCLNMLFIEGKALQYSTENTNSQMILYDQHFVVHAEEETGGAANCGGQLGAQTDH